MQKIERKSRVRDNLFVMDVVVSDLVQMVD
jgi:hypothetical protein